MLIWYPDYCTGGQCVIELDKTFHFNGPPKSFLTVTRAIEIGRDDIGNPIFEVISELLMCSHHRQLRDVQGLNDAQVFLAIRRSGQAKEAGRWALKQDLMTRGIVDKEYPGIPFTVETDGSITIRPSRDGSLPALAIPPNQRSRLRQLVITESEKIERVPGISRVILE